MRYQLWTGHQHKSTLLKYELILSYFFPEGTTNQGEKHLNYWVSRLTLKVRKTGSILLPSLICSPDALIHGNLEEEVLSSESICLPLGLAPFITQCLTGRLHNDSTLSLTKTNRNQGVFLLWRREQRTISNHCSHWLTSWWLAPFPWKQRAEQEKERLFRIIGGFVLWVAFFKI